MRLLIRVLLNALAVYVAAYLLEFLSIRPFADGIGRLGRILTNLLLLR